MLLGVTPWNLDDRSAASLSDQARTAEALGYASFWLPESHFSEHAIPDPLMLLAGVAAATSSIQLATTSYLLPLRNPLQAAEQVAVLDQLSNGRVILGVGRGYAPAMLRAFNVVPSEKRKLFERNLELMQRAWAGEPITIAEGEDPVILDPLPVQRPHPPIWVAAFGPKALAQAGRLGLPYLASPMETLEDLEANLAVHGAAAREAGHGEVATRPIMRTVFIGNSAREVRSVKERLQSVVPLTRRSKETVVDDWALIGESGFVAEKLAEYRQRLRTTHVVVTRLRIGGIEEHRLRESVARVCELL